MTAIGASATAAVAQSVVSYRYDALGRLTEVHDAAGYGSAYHHDQASNRTRVVAWLPYLQSCSAVSLSHAVGRYEAGGWSATVSDPQGHMVFGPYISSLTAGRRIAAYRMLIDNNAADNAAVAVLDVYDATDNVQLGQMTLYRTYWQGPNAYQSFDLAFDLSAARAGHQLEFRVYHLGTAYLRVERVGIR